MQDIATYLAGAKLDLITVLILLGVAVHRKYLVLGRELDREVEIRKLETAAREKVEVALKASNEREAKVNEANAQMAALVPDLLKLAASRQEGLPHEAPG